MLSLSGRRATTTRGTPDTVAKTAGEMGLNDTGLILEIVDRVVANHSVDESRVYLTGWSNGCSLSQKLANDHSDVFAAVACMSYYLLEDPNPDYSPIPIMEIHGLEDQIILYSNDAIHLPNMDAQKHGAIQNLQQWGNMNGCGDKTLTPTPPPCSTPSRRSRTAITAPRCRL